MSPSGFPPDFAPVVGGLSASDEDAAFDPAVEANHRIANNLAIIAGLIRSELSTLATDAPPNAAHIRRLLCQMSLRIDALGRLHRLLMDVRPGEGVELGTYLRGIVDSASQSLTDATHTKIRCLFSGTVVVSAKQAAAIGFFVVEAIVNSIKHAHPADEAGTIWVVYKTMPTGGVLIEIVDDGTRSPDMGPISLRIGAGLRLMSAIAYDLNAKLEFVKGDPGQTVRLLI